MGAALKLKTKTSANESISIDPDLIESVMNAVSKTFVDIFNRRVKVVKSDSNPSQSKYPREISGVSGFIQQSLLGTVAISFTRHSLQNLVESFYSSQNARGQSGVGDDQFVETLGEITNVIHGLLKRDLNWKGHSFSMCLPVVIMGNNHVIFSSLIRESLIVHFQVEETGHEFFVELNMYAGADSYKNK